MDGTLWEKVEQFLYQLHYEDTDRESHYESKSYLEALKDKEARVPPFRKAIEQLPERDRHAVQEYLDAEERCVYEENQQAYVQGIADCIEILSGTGMLKTTKKAAEIFAEINADGKRES